MRNEDYIVIQGWMRSLGLTDKQLLVYAMIWGFSRDGRSRMRGSAKYIAAAAGCSARHAKRLIYELENLGLIRHEVVATRRGLVSEFWALLPAEATAPEKGSRGKISWAGKGRGCPYPVGTRMSLPGGDIDVPTPKPLSSHSTGSNINKNTGGGKNSAPGRAKTTTTTGFLFEDIELPFQDDEHAAIFNDAWAKLRRQPKWQDKTPDALQIVLERLAATNDSLQAAWCCLKAVEKGWDTIKDPFQMYLDDEEEASAFIEFHQKQTKG